MKATSTGLWRDLNGRVLRLKGKEAVLTNRGFELLQFLSIILTASTRHHRSWDMPGQTPNCFQRKSATTFSGQDDSGSTGDPLSPGQPPWS
jgi:hypothetical protein